MSSQVLFINNYKLIRILLDVTAKLFSDILLKGIKAGQIPNRTDTARKWFREQGKRAGKINETKLLKDSKDQFRNRVFPGRMYFYFYDAKHKKTLPYFDRVPLIFVLSPAEGGFLGLNMHYLPLPLRAKLMDAFYSVTNNNKFNQTTKLKLTYELIKDAKKFKWFKPAIKHYLKKQVRSKFILVDAADWDTALFLPLARFQGASQTKVWKDSRAIIAGKNPFKKKR